MSAGAGVPYEVVHQDVLVIGAGGAGLRAAVAAAEAGVQVGVVTKSLLGKAHTVMAEGGVAAAFGHMDGQDTWQVHFQDTIKSGHFLNNAHMVELLTREAPDRVLELEGWGALFDRTETGEILQRAFGAHSFRRLAHVGDRTGKELIRTLQNRAVHQGVAVYPEIIITRLFRDARRIAGALGYRRADGRFILFRTPTVIVATGGWGRLYSVTSNSWETTGDGANLAFSVGAELVDMEMVQFHPTGMLWPPGVRGLLVTEGVRGEGGLLYNADHERFMTRYDPERMELSTRDVVARAISSEVAAGRGTPHGGAWLDISHRGAPFILRKLPGMRDQFLQLADVDITRQPMEIAPTVHYMMGGVRVDPDTCATAVVGLYAAGEVAAGVHGANRLGGNSLADLLVFGRRAGLAAAAEVRDDPQLSEIAETEVQLAIAEALAPLGRTAGANPYAIQADLRRTMSQYAGLIRTGTGLTQGLERVRALQRQAVSLQVTGGPAFNPGWNLALDLQAMLVLAEAIFVSAIERTESRGAHFREDFPREDPAWGRFNLITTRGGEGGLRVRREPVVGAEPAAARTERPATASSGGPGRPGGSGGSGGSKEADQT